MTTFNWWQVSAIKKQVESIKLSEFVARVLQVEIRFVVRTKAQMLAVILF